MNAIIDLREPQAELTSVNTAERRPDAGSVVHRAPAEGTRARKSLHKGISDIRHTNRYQLLSGVHRFSIGYKNV